MIRAQPPLSGLAWLGAWLETLPPLAATVVTSLTIATRFAELHVVAFLAGLSLALASLSTAQLLMVYAASRSPCGRPIRALGYLLACAAVAAYVAL
jgi:hypothetical protein